MTGTCPRIILASSSPRRAEIFACLGLPFEVARPGVEEAQAVRGLTDPAEMAERAALAKGRWVKERGPAEVVVSGDTTVVLNGKVLGKPSDAAEAISMLKRLRGKTHQVVTGLAVLDSCGRAFTSHVTADVVMRDYSDEEITEYVASGDPLDKAGAYGVQSESFHPAAVVTGCYLNVVGLPLCELKRLLSCAGVSLPGEVKLPASCGTCDSPANGPPGAGARLSPASGAWPWLPA